MMTTKKDEGSTVDVYEIILEAEAKILAKILSDNNFDTFLDVVGSGFSFIGVSNKNIFFLISFAAKNKNELPKLKEIKYNMYKTGLLQDSELDEIFARIEKHMEF